MLILDSFQPTLSYQMSHFLVGIKYQLGYPESARDMLQTKSVLTAVEQYSMGKARPLDEYKRIVGLNITTKEITYTGWCEEGYPPPGFEQYNHLYPNGRKRMKETAEKNNMLFST